MSEAAKAIGFSYQYFGGALSAGVGVLKSYASNKIIDADRKDCVFVEIYANYNLRSELFLTISIQRIVNSEFGLSMFADSSSSIATVRISREF